MAPLHCNTKVNHETTEAFYCGLTSFLQNFSKVRAIISCKYIIFPLFKFYATDYPVSIEKLWDVHMVIITITSTGLHSVAAIVGD
jgi:hypothetical protein